MGSEGQQFIESGVATCVCGNDILAAIKTDASVGPVWEYFLEIKPTLEPRDCCKAFIGSKMDALMDGVQAFVNATGQKIAITLDLDESAFNGQEKLDV